MTILQQIENLDPEADHERIVQLSTCFDFPWDTTRALEFALFRTFCVPSVSGLLERTGEFTQRAQKRYDDTDLLISEFMENGYSSPSGRRAIRRMNQIHSRWSIRNEDYLYVLSTFIFEPVRWNARFGWRPLCEKEKLAYFLFWRAVGRLMNLHDLPPGLAEFEAFNRDYESTYFQFSPSNRAVGTATCEVFVNWFPRLFAPLVRQGIYAMMDEPLRRAMGFPPAWPGLPGLVRLVLKLRSRVAGRLPTAAEPRRRGAIPRPDYPGGYRLEELGPPPAGRA